MRTYHLSPSYPFGMLTPGRIWSAGSEYRFGFGGFEKDDEVKGSGDSYTTLFRQYDPRIGRWLSPDPKMAKYPDWSPYNFAFNNPINITDPLGDDPLYEIENGVLKGEGVTNDITSTTHRPKMKVITAVVLHRTVSSSAESAVRTTKNNEGRTGFHIVVDKGGEITQVNNFENRANHVGKQKGDVSNYNSIGIEVVGNYNAETKTWDPLTEEQVENTAQAVNAILQEYDLTLENVYPHEDVSWKTPGEGQVVQDAIWGRVEELYGQSKEAKKQQEEQTPSPSQTDDLHEK
ncbi:MAG: N-acetylmuramoyl-L-alanine amidase [Bacteroidetes bacterium]|nr:N-acetylmuramoyl-L-alanine amidase [Bacteroidota bacterium]